MGSIYLGPVGGFTGELDLNFLVGDQASAVSVPIEPVTLIPSVNNDVVLTGSGPVELARPGRPRRRGHRRWVTIVADLQANVFGSNIPNSIPAPLTAVRTRRSARSLSSRASRSPSR